MTIPFRKWLLFLSLTFAFLSVQLSVDPVDHNHTTPTPDCVSCVLASDLDPTAELDANYSRAGQSQQNITQPSSKPLLKSYNAQPIRAPPSLS